MLLWSEYNYRHAFESSSVINQRGNHIKNNVMMEAENWTTKIVQTLSHDFEWNNFSSSKRKVCHLGDG